jgi:hypothetical protein
MPHQGFVAFERAMQWLLAGQVMPSCAKRRPTELALNFMPNLSSMSLATISRVHNARHYSAEGLLCVCRRLQCVI